MRNYGVLLLIVWGATLWTASGVGLAEDWTMLGGGPDHTSFRADPLALPVSLLWKYNAAQESGVVIAWSSPAVSGDAVFFCYDTDVYCVDRWTGQL